MARDFAKAFYKSKEWEQVREYIRKRDNYLCRVCGARGEEVHHIEHLTPENIWNPNVTLNPGNLILLCRTCHIAKHTKDTATAHIKDDGKREAAQRLNEYVFDENGMLVPRE